MDDVYLPLNRDEAASWSTSCAILHCPSCQGQATSTPNNTLVLQANNRRSSSFGVCSCYPWLKNLRCGTCYGKWAICITCVNVRKAFTTKQQVLRHNRRKHFPISTNLNRDNHQNMMHRGEATTRVAGIAEVPHAHSDDDVNGDFDDSAAEGNNDEGINAEGNGTARTVTFPFKGDRNIRYFTNDHHGLGVAYLVSQSQFGMDFLMDRLLQEDLSFQLHLASLISGMSRGQQQNFAIVMSKYHRVSTLKSEEAAKRLNSEQTMAAPAAPAPRNDQTNFASTNCWFSRMPTTFEDLRQLYLEGKTSFIPNLPRPNVITLPNHAYVSIIDCIADILAHGLALDTIVDAGRHEGADNVRTTTSRGSAFARNSQSQQCQDIYRRGHRVSQQQRLRNRGLPNSIVEEEYPLVCLWINEWSDGFEPSYSVKANRGSAWLKTITISPPANKLHSLDYTYPIAVGKSNSSHEEVEKLFARELTKLANNTDGRLFYHGGLKQNVRVHAELNVSLMDQPERRGANYIMLGGGTYTSRWRHSANFLHVSPKLKACDDCLANVLLENQYQESRQRRLCRQCTCWSTEDCDSILEYPVPADFPQDMTPTSRTLRPVVLTYEGLQCAARTAHEKVFNGTWTTKGAKAFLRIQGMNLEAVNGITECAINCRKVSRAQPGSLEFQKLMELKIKSPHSYLPWEIPALWSRAGVTLDQHVDVPMHLLFLGITKTVVLMIQEWTLGRRKEAAFLRYANEAMTLPVRLGLDWCKALPFGKGRLGGFVAENYLAVARLSTWLYSTIKVIVRPSGAPALLITEIGGSADNVFNVVAALHAMISRLMKRVINDDIIRDCERHIHIFLSFFSKFDADLRGEHKRTWVRCYNFMSLLNLPGVLRKYGPLRNMWEGGGQGERVLSIVKPSWGGYRKNWMHNMLDRMLRHMAIERIKSKEEPMNFTNTGTTTNDASTGVLHEDINILDNNAEIINPNDGEFYFRNDEEEIPTRETVNDGHQQQESHDQHQRGRNYVNYKSEESVRQDFDRRLPLSVLRLRTGEFVCMIAKTRALQILPTIQVAVVDDDGNHQVELSNFFQWRLEPIELSSDVELKINNCCLLLPKLNCLGKPLLESPLYTVIDSEWNVLHNENGCWIMSPPNFPGATYEMDGRIIGIANNTVGIDDDGVD